MPTIVKVLDNNQEVASFETTKEQALVIDAISGAYYQLAQSETQLAPQNIVTERLDNDLLIFLNDSDPDADIVIQDYYVDGQPDSQIIGEHENGNIYSYVPESAESTDAISLLADEISAPQALGSDTADAASWSANPWWIIGAGVLTGVAIAAAIHDSDDDDNAQTVSTTLTFSDLDTDGDSVASLSSVSNVSIIDLTDGDNTLVDVNVESVSNNPNLYIKGDSGDTVNIGYANDSDTNYSESEDGSGSTWADTGEDVTLDGVTYSAWQYGDTSTTVYIEDGITVI